MASGPEAADSEGLRTAYLSYGGELLGFARQFLKGIPTLPRRPSRTFARAWRSRDSFNSELGALPRVALHDRASCPDRHCPKRSAHPTQSIEHEPIAQENEIERAMVGWQVEEAIRRLRPEHRQVLVRTYFGQRSGQELAHESVTPTGTVVAHSSVPCAHYA